MNEIGTPPLEPRYRRRRDRGRHGRSPQQPTDAAPVLSGLTGAILGPRDSGADLAIPLTIAAAALLAAVFVLAVLL